MGITFVSPQHTHTLRLLIMRRLTHISQMDKAGQGKAEQPARLGKPLANSCVVLLARPHSQLFFCLSITQKRPARPHINLSMSCRPRVATTWLSRPHPISPPFFLRALELECDRHRVGRPNWRAKEYTPQRTILGGLNRLLFLSATE